MEKFRVVISANHFEVFSKNVNSVKEAEDFIYKIMERHKAKRAYLFNKETKERKRLL